MVQYPDSDQTVGDIGQAARPDRARQGPPRPRPPLRHRRGEGPRRAGLDPAHRLLRRAGADRRLVRAEPRLVGAGPHRRVSDVLRAQLRGSMTTLVTGANGLVGRRLVERLAAAGERVAATGRGPRRDGLRGVEYVELDLRNAGKLGEWIESLRPRSVLHAAGMTDVDGCEEDPAGAWALNLRAVEECAAACRSVGARLIALSTDYVFDGERGPYGEDDAPNPRGVYARSKRAGEEAALSLAPDCAVARVAVVYSGRRGAKRTFATAAAEQLLAGKEVRAFHDQVVSPTLADNAAEMVIGLWRSGQGGIWHCAGASIVSRVEFCRALARKLRADERLVVPVPMSAVKLPAPRPARCGLEVTRIRRLLGPSVPLELDEALDRFVAERAA